MVVTNKTEQGRQYKEYTREATGNKAERIWKAALELPVFL